jgi:hypothetical protein
MHRLWMSALHDFLGMPTGWGARPTLARYQIFEAPLLPVSSPSSLPRSVRLGHAVGAAAADAEERRWVRVPAAARVLGGVHPVLPGGGRQPQPAAGHGGGAGGAAGRAAGGLLPEAAAALRSTLQETLREPRTPPPGCLCL